MSGKSYDPECDGPYHLYLKNKGIGHMSRTHATKDQLTVHRENGVPVAQTIRDQLGHETTEHACGRVDVTINLGATGGDL